MGGLCIFRIYGCLGLIRRRNEFQNPQTYLERGFFLPFHLPHLDYESFLPIFFSFYEHGLSLNYAIERVGVPGNF